MQLSLRSQMIAGTTALVGASAIALTPVAPAVNLPALKAPSLANIALAAFDSPITALLNTSVMATNYLFSNADPADVAQRVQNAREDVADAKDAEAKASAEAMLSHLELLEKAVSGAH